MSSVDSSDDNLTEAAPDMRVMPDSCSSHEKHLQLAGVVKGVHADLRRKYRSNASDLERIWYEHCQNKTMLSHYANAMHHLAVDHWSKNPETRIHWCRETIIEYFLQDGLKKVMEKEERRKLHEENREKSATDVTGEMTGEKAAGRSDILEGEDGFASSVAVAKHNFVSLPFEGQVRILDVGSCFNPFLEFPEFQAVGIDISPATDSVFHCDFLHLRTTDPLQVATDTMATFINNLKDPVEWLPRQSFHVVIFSLLLEYFPAPYQRWICCQKAHELLVYNGILVVVTPDSHAQHRNAPMIKSWKTAIESMGFKRWRYVKQEHLHCMVFRKVSVETKGSNFINGITADLLYIPQDSEETDSHLDDLDFGTECYSFEDEQFYKDNTLTELPVFASDSEEA